MTDQEKHLTASLAGYADALEFYATEPEPASRMREIAEHIRRMPEVQRGEETEQ